MSTGTVAGLDWMRERLSAPRRVLVEASAGTGKTHAITLLYLRLLLEAQDEASADVRGILVSTFTEAAASELRQRLRMRLGEVEKILASWAEGDAEAGAEAPADSIAAYLKNVLPLPADIALLRVRRARQDLDLAPILTMHAFCARVLAESAFESGVDLAPGDHVDEALLIEECVGDFWRQRYQQGNVDLDERDLVLPAGPEALVREVVEYFTLAEPRCLGGGREAVDAGLAQLNQPEQRDAIARLANDRMRYAPRKSKLARRLNELHACLVAGAGRSQLLRVLQEITLGLVIEQQHPDQPLLSKEPVIQQCLHVAALARDWPQIVRGEVLAAAIEFCRSAVPHRLVERGCSTFGSLIARVRERVTADGEFARHLHQRYPVALIDEFQDTDRHQYAIFDAIYAGRGTMVLVGDPKQAIYGFRGGDIATYRQAERQVDSHVSLLVNWRSTRAYVDAVNGLYATAPADHMGEGIAYQPVSAGGKADAEAFRIDDQLVARPLVIRLPGSAGLSTLGDADESALEACAADITNLLSEGRCSLGSRPVEPGDIAVLLPTNAQIATLREKLAKRGVPAAGSGKVSVFATESAAELTLLLDALLEPAPGLLNAAWLTDLWGMDAAMLRALEESPASHEAHWQEFQAIARLWQERGPMAPVLALAERAAPRILARQDGERVLTDLRHLGELLQQQAAMGASMHGQLAWLRRQRIAPDGDVAEHLQRIDSDRARVQLRTLASAKGLQWPMVFLPMAWRPEVVGRKRQLLRFHDDNDQLSVDLGSAFRADHAERSLREAREERARLLYVALTRAEQACWVYWLEGGRTSSVAGSALGELLQGSGWAHAVQFDDPDDAGEADDRVSRLNRCRESLAHVELDVTAPNRMARFTQPIAVARARAARPVPPPAQPWQHWSFTALVRRSTGEPKAAADESDAISSVLVEAAGPDVRVHGDLEGLSALRGPAFGDAVHALLENAVQGTRFSRDPATLARHLVGTGVMPDSASALPLSERLAARLDSVRTADLGQGLCLDALTYEVQVAEMEFLLPLNAIPASRLHRLLESHGVGSWLPDIGSDLLRGMLGGFIDRVAFWNGRYYVIDYKTNWLGMSIDDYLGGSLDRAMRAHHYHLQALLYVLAVHRLLRQRVPGYDYRHHMGDALYLFVRAVGLAPDAGLWRGHFDANLVHELDRLCDGAGQ